MKKIMSLAVFLLLAASAVFARGGGAAGPEETLTLIGGWAGPEMEQFMPVLKAFEEKENVTVKYRIYRAEDLSSLMPVQFDAGQAPGDVIAMWDWWVIENHDAAVDLSDIWAPEKNSFIAPAVEAGGKVVTVPFTMVVKPGFWYRKSFFAEHGLEAPGTWDEFADLLRKIGNISGIKAPIATGNGVGWPISDVTEHFIIAVGGAELHKSLIAKSTKWTDPDVRNVFDNYIVPLLEEGAFSDPIEWTQAVELWWGGDYGLFFMGNWITGMVKDPDDLGVFSLPGTKAVVGGADTFFIPKYSENVELAKKLLAFMISKEGLSIRAALGGKLVTRGDIPVSTYPPADQALVEVVNKMDDLIPDMDDTIGGDWQRLFWDQLKLLWVDPDSIDDVLKKLQGGM